MRCCCDPTCATTTERPTQEWTLVFAHFHPRAEWLPLLDWPIRAGTIGYIHSPDEVHRRITAELRRTARAGVRPQLQSKLFAVNALESALLWLDTQNPLRGRTDARILRVMEHIASHLDGDLSVTALAKVAHLSRSRLTHLFSEHLGASPQRFVERERMARAAQLLDFSDLSIGEIARAVGWDDPLYFSQRFRASHRMSPTAYRRRSAGLRFAALPETSDFARDHPVRRAQVGGFARTRWSRRQPGPGQARTSRRPGRRAGPDRHGDLARSGRAHDRERPPVVGRDARPGERLLGARPTRPEAGEHSGAVDGHGHEPVGVAEHRAGLVLERDRHVAESVDVDPSPRPEPRAAARPDAVRSAWRPTSTPARRATATSSPGRYSVSNRARKAFSPPTAVDPERDAVEQQLDLIGIRVHVHRHGCAGRDIPRP